MRLIEPRAAQFLNNMLLNKLLFNHYVASASAITYITIESQDALHIFCNNATGAARARIARRLGFVVVGVTMNDQAAIQNCVACVSHAQSVACEIKFGDTRGI